MSDAPENSELTAAIVKGVVLDGILLVAGVTLYLTTGALWGIIGAAVLGSSVTLWLMAQAGAFSQNNDRS